MGKPNTSLSALNEMLFDQLEKITNDDLTPEELEAEEKRTKMITSVSGQILENAALELKAIKTCNEMVEPDRMPSVFGLLESDNG